MSIPVSVFMSLLLLEDLAGRPCTPVSADPCSYAGGWVPRAAVPQKMLKSVVDWMFVSPQNSCVEALPPNVLLFRDETFGRRVGAD